MKEKFYTRYLLLNTLLLILSLAFWLVISDLYMKCLALTSLYIFSEVALIRIMCDDKKVYISFAFGYCNYGYICDCNDDFIYESVSFNF